MSEIKMYYKFKYELDDFQKKGFIAINNDENILVTAHTGAGKTSLALHAIARTLQLGKKVIYTSPIKTLSNQKYFEFKQDFDDVGILTGDIKMNPNADLLIMTAEILKNSINRKYNDTIYEYNFNPEQVGCVILDEVHFINNPDRGYVWEEIIVNLKKNIQLVMLSATINGADNIANWVSKLKETKCHLIGTEKRPVPLSHNIFYNNQLYNINSDFDKYIHKYKFDENKGKLKTDNTYLLNCLNYIINNNLYPSICFILNKKLIESIAYKLPLNLLDKDEIVQVNKIIDYKMRDYKHIYEKTIDFNKIRDLLLKGIGIHHAGLIPMIKEIVEILYDNKLIKILFATETFAMGVNMPTKSVLFYQLTKYDKCKRLLRPEEYIQMAGRAGRRGYDKFGTVILMPKKYNLDDLNKMINSKPQKIESRIKLDIDYILKLLSNHYDNEQVISNEQVINFLESKMKNTMLNTEFKSIISNLEKQILDKKYYDKYSDDLIQFNILKNKKVKNKKQLKKHKEELNKYNHINDDIIRYFKVKEEYNNYLNIYKTQIRLILEYLQKHKLMDENYILTEQGKILSNITEGNSILLGKLINNNFFNDLEFNEICSILTCFIKDDTKSELKLNDKLDKKLLDLDVQACELMDDEIELNNLLNFKFSNEYTLYSGMFNITLEWAKEKDWIEVNGLYEGFTGNFIKNILRLVSMLRNLELISVISNNNILLDKIYGYEEKLVRDIVIVDSLYVQ